MDIEEYKASLRMLGVHGPMGEMRRGGEYILAYKLPDDSRIYLPPADKMTDEQRAEVIEELRIHLGIFEANRNPDTGDL